ncbi:hypothetical protein GGD46_004091 [Rhizobium lusitanum]|uniref:Uncharacterized protein n=1 Tax=Rhizobium lusitanum TaxID=293958 RepID=A0A7X0IUA3_9HYPH|nr:hypothetical protein [Rhizobium lusitanum]
MRRGVDEPFMCETGTFAALVSKYAILPASDATLEKNFTLHQTKVRVQRRFIRLVGDRPDRRYHCHPSAVCPAIRLTSDGRAKAPAIDRLRHLRRRMRTKRQVWGESLLELPDCPETRPADCVLPR